MNTRHLTAAGLVLLSGSLLAALVLMLQEPTAGASRQPALVPAAAVSSAASPTTAPRAPVVPPRRATSWPDAIRQAEGVTDAAGCKQGAWRLWHANGQLRFEGTFADGKLDATKPWREYNADGSIRFDSDDGPPPAALLSPAADLELARF